MPTVARTLMGNPPPVLLDEPSQGVAPLIVEQMADAIVELKKQGLAVLLSEQISHLQNTALSEPMLLKIGTSYGRDALTSSMTSTYPPATAK